MDRTFPTPDILATEVPIESLTSTARSIATAAQELGYRVKATRALGPRLPKLARQEVVRTRLLTIAGRRGDFGFHANHTDTDGWEVTLRRPGWPDLPSSIVGLRLMLKAQATKTAA